MSRFLLLILILCTSFVVNAGYLFTPQERAYLFHIVKKNKVLDRNLGSFFEYTGELVMLDAYTYDFDSIETIIVNDPTLLKIDFDGVARAHESILAETASKLGLWKLTNILYKPMEDANNAQYNAFMSMLKQNLPDAAYRDDSRKQWVKNIGKLINPGLSLLEKRDILDEIEDVSLKKKMAILQSLDDTYKTFSNQLTYKYFKLLGGSNAVFENVVLAAGEGSKTNGLMEEFEKKENGKPDYSKPKGIGLFTYQYSIKKNNAGLETIFAKTDPIVTYEGFNDPKNTNLHLSLWGFNAAFQTTVVIKTGLKSYVLYANRKTMELSPDSSYLLGKTYQQHIDEIEKDYIPKLDKSLYGAEGLWNNYDRWGERIDKAYKNVRDAEMEMRQYTLDKNNKKLKKARNKYIDNSNILEQAKSKQRKLFRTIYAKEQELEFYQDQLYYMKSNIGFDVVEYVYADSIFKFEDGAYFDPYTQDFHFKDIPQGRFTVRLISIGSKPLSKQVDEVQLMVNAMHKDDPKQIYVDLELDDAFTSNSFMLDSLPQSFINSTKLDSLLDYIVQNNQLGNTYVFGGGIGQKLDDGTIIRHPEQTEIEKYPGLTNKEREKNKNKAAFKDLRTTKVSIYIDGTFNVKVSAYTDPVMCVISDSDTNFMKLKETKGFLKDNQMLSCLRAMNAFDMVIQTLQNRLANRSDLSIQEISEASEILSKTREQAVVKYKSKQISYAEYKELYSLSPRKDE